MTYAYDFIVVGAGASGCAVAHGLIEREAGSVLVIEAGPSDRWPLVRMPFGLVWLMGSRNRDWRYTSAPQPGLGGTDASVMPRITSANTNAPSIMIGHRAGQMIAEAA